MSAQSKRLKILHVLHFGHIFKVYKVTSDWRRCLIVIHTIRQSDAAGRLHCLQFSSFVLQSFMQVHVHVCFANNWTISECGLLPAGQQKISQHWFLLFNILTALKLLILECCWSHHSSIKFCRAWYARKWFYSSHEDRPKKISCCWLLYWLSHWSFTL